MGIMFSGLVGGLSSFKAVRQLIYLEMLPLR
jgi:hypothetical protein